MPVVQKWKGQVFQTLEVAFRPYRRGHDGPLGRQLGVVADYPPRQFRLLVGPASDVTAVGLGKRHRRLVEH